MPVGLQELDVPGVRLEADVEEVAEQGDGADGDVDQHVSRHARGDDPGHLVMAQRHQHQPGLDQSGEHVAADRQQADDRVEPDANPRARDVEGPIHQPGEPLEVAGHRLATVELGVVVDRPGFGGCLAHAAVLGRVYAFVRREIAVIQGGRRGLRRRGLGDDLAARRVVLAGIRGIGTEDVRLVRVEVGPRPARICSADSRPRCRVVMRLTWRGWLPSGRRPTLSLVANAVPFASERKGLAARLESPGRERPPRIPTPGRSFRIVAS